MNIENSIKKLITNNNLPTPLILRLKAFQNYKDSFRRVWIIRDVLEILIKYNVAFSLGVKFHFNAFTKNQKDEILELLKMPQLGQWLKLLKEHGDLSKYDNIKKWKLNDYNNFVNLADKIKAMRNDYAHGAVPSDITCESDLNTFFPLLVQMIEVNKILDYDLLLTDYSEKTFLAKGNELNLLKDISLQPNSAYIKIDEKLNINLFPVLMFLQYKEDKKLFFYNDYKNLKVVSLLNYEIAFPIKDIPNVKKNIDEFFHVTNNSITYKESDTINIINERLNSFIGRVEELAKIDKLIKEKGGFFYISGVPGIGKTSFVSKLYDYCSLKNYRTVPVFIKSGKLSGAYEILFELSKSLFPANKKINFKLNELSQSIQKSIEVLSSREKHLIIILDGLDETRNLPELIKYLPITLPSQNVSFIFSSRKNKLVDDYYNDIATNKNKLELEGLTVSNIREILYSYLNKYELQDNHVDIILRNSKGNPLYIALLCKDIENGYISFENLSTIPNELTDFYKTIIKRLDSDAIKVLIVIAISPAPISSQIISNFTDIDRIKVDEILENLSQVLLINRDKNKRLLYQIYHETFINYLLINYEDYAEDYNKKILSFCENYNTYSHESEKYSFAVSNLLKALIRNKEIDKIKKLAINSDFIDKLSKLQDGNFFVYDLFESARENTASDNFDDLIELAMAVEDFENKISVDVNSIIEKISKREYSEVKRILQGKLDYKENYIRLLLLTMIDNPNLANEIYKDNSEEFKAINLFKPEEILFLMHYLPNEIQERFKSLLLTFNDDKIQFVNTIEDLLQKEIQDDKFFNELYAISSKFDLYSEIKPRFDRDFFHIDFYSIVKLNIYDAYLISEYLILKENFSLSEKFKDFFNSKIVSYLKNLSNSSSKEDDQEKLYKLEIEYLSFSYFLNNYFTESNASIVSPSNSLIEYAEKNLNEYLNIEINFNFAYALYLVSKNRNDALFWVLSNKTILQNEYNNSNFLYFFLLLDFANIDFNSLGISYNSIIELLDNFKSDFYYTDEKTGSDRYIELHSNDKSLDTALKKNQLLAEVFLLNYYDFSTENFGLFEILSETTVPVFRDNIKVEERHLYYTELVQSISSNKQKNYFFNKADRSKYEFGDYILVRDSSFLLFFMLVRKIELSNDEKKNLLKKYYSIGNKQEGNINIVKLELAYGFEIFYSTIEKKLNELFFGEYIFVLSPFSSYVEDANEIYNDKLIDLIQLIEKSSELLNNEIDYKINEFNIYEYAKNNIFKYLSESQLINFANKVAKYDLAAYCVLCNIYSKDKKQLETYKKNFFKNNKIDLTLTKEISNGLSVITGVENIHTIRIIRKPNADNSFSSIDSNILSQTEIILKTPSFYSFLISTVNHFNAIKKKQKEDPLIEAKKIAEEENRNNYEAGMELLNPYSYSNNSHGNYEFDYDLSEYGLSESKFKEITSVNYDKSIWFDSLISVLTLFASIGIIDFNHYFNYLMAAFYPELPDELYDSDNPLCYRVQKQDFSFNNYLKDINSLFSIENPIDINVLHTFLNNFSIEEVSFEALTLNRLSPVLKEFLFNSIMRKAILEYYFNKPIAKSFVFECENLALNDLLSTINYFNRKFSSLKKYITNKSEEDFLNLVLPSNTFNYALDYNTEYENNLIKKAFQENRLISSNGSLHNLFFNKEVDLELLETDELLFDFQSNEKHLSVDLYQSIKSINQELDEYSELFSNSDNGKEGYAKLFKESLERMKRESLKFENTINKIKDLFNSGEVSSLHGKIVKAVENNSTNIEDYIDDNLCFKEAPDLFLEKETEYVVVDDKFKEEWKQRFDDFFINGGLKKIMSKYYT